MTRAELYDIITAIQKDLDSLNTIYRDSVCCESNKPLPEDVSMDVGQILLHLEEMIY